MEAFSRQEPRRTLLSVTFIDTGVPNWDNTYMQKVTVYELQHRLKDCINSARDGEPVVITRRGTDVAVMVSVDEYDRLREDESEVQSRVSQ